MDPKLKLKSPWMWITNLIVIALAVVVVVMVFHFLFGDYRAEQNTKKFVAKVVTSSVSAKVPEWTWVTVKNPNGVESGNAHHAFNEQCGIMEGGELHQVKVVGDEVLVLYISPRGQGVGSECGNETIFFVPKTAFDLMSASYKDVLDAREIEKNKIRELLK